MKCFYNKSAYPQKEEHPETPKNPESILLDALQRTRYDLEAAYNGFNEACDPELIDCYIYEVTALTKRYDYLLHQVSRLRCIEEVEESDTETPVALVSQVLA